MNLMNLAYKIILFFVLLISISCKKETLVCDTPGTAKIFGLKVPDSAQISTPIIADIQWRRDYNCEFVHKIDTFLSKGSIYFRLQTKLNGCYCNETFEYNYNSFTFSVDTPGPIAIEATFGQSGHFIDTLYIVP